VALAVFLARHQASRQQIRDEIRRRFGYALLVPLDLIRPGYTFDVSCQGSVPVAITAFLESTDWEDAVRKAVSVGGDTDTIACMAGAIAHAFYGEVPGAIADQVLDRLDAPLRDTTVEFCDAYDCF
jgi:ADP-ribosylglycohydrolase